MEILEEHFHKGECVNERMYERNWQMKGLSKGFVDLIMHVEQTLCPQYCGVVDRRRVIAYIFLTFIELVIIPLHFFLFLTWWEPYGFTVACVHLLTFAVIQTLIWRQSIEFSSGFAALYLMVAAKLLLDSVFCTVFGVLTDNVTVLGNIFILVILAISAMSMMLNKVALITTVALVPLVGFYVLSQRSEMMLFILKPILVGFVMIVYVFTYNMSKITKGLRQPQEVSQEEKKALEMLVNLKDVTGTKNTNLIERLSPELRQRIVHHASEHLRKEELEKLAWDLVCADLTKSETEICRLILEGFTLKEICDKLNKSESNITSQRCHIRKKLNMNRNDDLRRTLECRVAEIRKTI